MHQQIDSAREAGHQGARGKCHKSVGIFPTWWPDIRQKATGHDSAAMGNALAQEDGSLSKRAASPECTSWFFVFYEFLSQRLPHQC